MAEMKHCGYCHAFKPVTSLIPKKTSAGTRHMCTTCVESRKRTRTVAERDAFGRKISARNYLLQATLSKRLAEDKKKENEQTL